MSDQKWQHGVVELARANLGEEVSTARKKLHLGCRDQPSELLGKISRGDDIILRPDHQCWRLDALQLA